MTTGDSSDSMRRGIRSEGHSSVGQYAFAADERVSVASVGSVVEIVISTARCSNSLNSSRRRDSHQCCYLAQLAQEVHMWGGY